jgi:hypothetical protein
VLVPGGRDCNKVSAGCKDPGRLDNAYCLELLLLLLLLLLLPQPDRLLH